MVLPDVHDGPVGLGVEPREAPGVLRQQLPDGLPELRVGGQGPDGQDVLGQEGERAGLELAERVAHHHLGERAELLRLGAQLEQGPLPGGRDEVDPRQLRRVQRRDSGGKLDRLITLWQTCRNKFKFKSSKLRRSIQSKMEY